MSIGYACLTIGVPDTDLKSCIMKNADESRLLELISYNLNSLDNIIEYNNKNNIHLFRISSDIIPFGSSPVNNLKWWKIFSQQLSDLGKKILKSGMRVSMHPGQYTVLNSPNKDVVNRAIEDLNYHTRFLDSLGVGEDHKIVLHIGGVYNDKKQAIRRFLSSYHRLSEQVKRRLVIENDDKLYCIGDVLEIGSELSIPVIYDNLHNDINPTDRNRSDLYWITQCKTTWRVKDGHQKVHYSQQDPLKKAGSHSTSIKIDLFLDYYDKVARPDLDVMLEVKDKNLSAIKCINCTSEDKNLNALELEWSRYKYAILERSPVHYDKIQKNLQNKDCFSIISFYQYIEESLDKGIKAEYSINTMEHIWDSCKGIVSENDENNFLNNLEKAKKEMITLKSMKKILWRILVKYDQLYLIDSYFFL